MEQLDYRHSLERITLPRLIGYLDPSNSRRWEVSGADISAVRIVNRTGVPVEAETYRYTIHFSAGAWAVTVRSVWYNGQIHRPYGTHLVVESYDDIEGIHGSPWTVQGYMHEWLRGVPGL